MVDDLAGAAIEVLLSAGSPDHSPKRFRKGCQWLSWIVLAAAAITLAVIWFNR
jgi:hypothetical protein